MEKEKFNLLLERILTKSKDAIEEFYRDFGKTVYVFAMAICHNCADADEIVNDVLYKISKLAPPAKEIKNPFTWLYKITENAARDTIRKHPWQPLDENMPDERDLFGAVDARLSFFKAIENLTADEQAIIGYKFLGDLTFDDIAALMEQPLSTVSSTYYRAIKKLQEEKYKKLRKK